MSGMPAKGRFGRKRKPKALPRVLFRRGRLTSVRMKDELTDRALMEKRFDELEQKLDELAGVRIPHA